MKPITLLLSICLLATCALADEWGDWDDLPDNLLTPSESTDSAIDQLYSRLSWSSERNDEDRMQAISDWLDGLDLDFQSNEELEDLLKDLAGESPDDIAEELEDWLEDQSDDALDELMDESDEFDDDEFDDEPDEEDDELDDDEVDEVELDS